MPQYALTHETAWNEWRRAARAFVLGGVAPADLLWSVGGVGDPMPDADGGFSWERTDLVDTLRGAAR